MAEYEEMLRIIVKTQDETSEVVNKINGKMVELEARQRQVIDQSTKTSKAIGGIGDAFGLIIKRSPYVLGADLLARITGARNLMSVLNTTLDSVADGFQRMAKEMVGITPQFEEGEKLVKGYREELEKLLATQRSAQGWRDLPGNFQINIPSNLAGNAEALRLLAEASEKMQAIESKVGGLFIGANGAWSTRTKAWGAQEQAKVYEQLRASIEDLWYAEKKRTENAAATAEQMKVQAREAEKIKAAWRDRSWWGGGTLPSGAEFGAKMLLDLTGGMARTAATGAGFGSGVIQFVDAFGEHVKRSLPVAGQFFGAFQSFFDDEARTRARLLSDVEAMRSSADPFAGKYAGETTDQKMRAIRGLLDEQERLNNSTRKQIGLWEDIGQSIDQSAGYAIANLLTDIQDGNDALRNLMRFLQLTINQAAGKWLASVIDFKSANGNVFSGGNQVAFARGGVVGGPTTFPMSGGRTGLMGEAGPEAIMPLRRDASGRLGVEAGGGRQVSINLQVVSLDPRSAADVILDPKVFSQLSTRLASAIAMGENRSLRSAIVGAR